MSARRVQRRPEIQDTPPDGSGFPIERLVNRIGLPVGWLSLAIAAGLIGGFIGTMALSGGLTAFMQQDQHWWQSRDARIAIVAALIAAYLPAARIYQQRGTQDNLQQLRERFHHMPDNVLNEQAAFEVDRKRHLMASTAALLLAPLVGLLVDRDPTLYFQSHYWGAAQVWTWALGSVVLWNTGALAYETVTHARAFARIAARLPEVDFFDLESLRPFSRQALRSALRGIIVIAFLAPNLVDQDFLWALALLSSVSLIWSSLPVYTVMRAVRDRVHTAKISELARLNAALRGDTRLLDGSLLARRASELRVVDLLAYREFVAAVPEWAFDNLARARLTLYLLLPLGSWLGGALVERALSALLGGD